MTLWINSGGKFHRIQVFYFSTDESGGLYPGCFRSTVNSQQSTIIPVQPELILHVADLSIEQFLSQRDRFVELLKEDYFFGTGDVSMTAKTAGAMFQHGILGWLDAMPDKATGSAANSDFEQLATECNRTFFGGSMNGDVKWVPEELVPNDGLVRDGGLATIGGGNHFVEIPVVEEVVDRATAYTWGVRSGQIAFMIHSGSLRCCTILNKLFMNRQDACSTKSEFSCGTGILPVKREWCKM